MNGLNYKIQGNTNLPVVLFLHGFMGDNQDFDEVICQISHQFCCLTVDLPGHGNTIVKEMHFTMSKTATLVLDVLNQLQIHNCYLVGYSMGGRLALYLALQFPQRFPKVVLESSSPGLKTDPERQARIQHDDALANQLEADFTSFLANWYNQPLFQPLKQRPNFDQILQRRSHHHPHQLAQSLRYLSTGRQPSLWEALKQHTRPLLLLVGEKDAKFQAINQDMIHYCPSAQLETIADCGHTIHLEHPTVFAQHIQTFFSQTFFSQTFFSLVDSEPLDS